MLHGSFRTFSSLFAKILTFSSTLLTSSLSLSPLLAIFFLSFPISIFPPIHFRPNLFPPNNPVLEEYGFDDEEEEDEDDEEEYDEDPASWYIR